MCVFGENGKHLGDMTDFSAAWARHREVPEAHRRRVNVSVGRQRSIWGDILVRDP